jgi:hypothetical protein
LEYALEARRFYDDFLDGFFFGIILVERDSCFYFVFDV